MLSFQSTSTSIRVQASGDRPPFASESIHFPGLIGTEEIVKDTGQESPAKSTTVCSKWGQLLTH